MSPQIDLIPSYPGSKILVPKEQIFGKTSSAHQWGDKRASAPTGQTASSIGGEVVSPSYAQPPGVNIVANKNVQRPLFKPTFKPTQGAGNAGNQAINNASPSSSRPNPGIRGGDRGKRAIDAEGFQLVASRKAFRAKQQSSGYISPNVFDLLKEMPSHETLAALEEACNTAEKQLQVPRTLDNLEINMLREQIPHRWC